MSGFKDRIAPVDPENFDLRVILYTAFRAGLQGSRDPFGAPGLGDGAPSGRPGALPAPLSRGDGPGLAGGPTRAARWA